MKTKIRIDDALLQRAWKEAERRGTSLASIVEEGLRLALRMTPGQPTARITRLSTFFAPRRARRDSDVMASVKEDQD